MIKKRMLLPVFLVLFISAFPQQKILRKGLKISGSAIIQKNIYKIDAENNLTAAVILIEGDNVIVDFKNSILKGSSGSAKPDEFSGVALLIQNSKRVTVKNLNVHGYKIALLARNVEELIIDNCDFSYNYRRHLNSTPEKEDLSDWLSYHHNDKDEWLRYGAAIYLRGCNKATIKNCRVTNGQNALMLMECNDASVYNNDFSFNSGIGIGLYRSSRNKIMFNRLIFNVRGYSDGVYSRGQDSAGLLVYEQSSNNLFYKNNVTHGGDGFFLWAGQTTMDSGLGGCNDNMIRDNDFSYAVANGIEATFSRNTIVDNRIFECDYGIWGGYSYESVISNNKFRNNKTGIAIEHGQQNKISYNIFFRDKKAIRLWGNEEQPSGWGYAKNKDTKSRDYIIAFNNFNNNETVFDLNRTSGLNLFNNIYQEYGQLFKMDSSVSGMDTLFNDELAARLSADTSPDIQIPDKPANPFKNTGTVAGKKNILITEWGPYDFRSPIIRNTNSNDQGDVMVFELKGPAGKWRIKTARGVDSLSATSGVFPATITAKKIKRDRTDIHIDLEYTGEPAMTPFGIIIPKGRPFIFSFKKFYQPVDWNVSWFAMDTTVFNPLTAKELFPANARFRPVKTAFVADIDYAWWNGLQTGGGDFSQFITIAEGSSNFIKGKYELGVTWDDAVRVYVDNKLVLDEWRHAGHDFDGSPHRKVLLNLDGNHSFRIEHLSMGGFAVLSLQIKLKE